jgi:hypothetical protein
MVVYVLAELAASIFIVGAILDLYESKLHLCASPFVPNLTEVRGKAVPQQTYGGAGGRGGIAPTH